MPTPQFQIRPATLDDLAAAASLFASFPFKKTQQAVQRLERAKLDGFFRDALARGLAAGKPHWIVFDGAAPVALAGLSDPTWHSEIYGFPMARVEPWINALRPEAGPALLDAVETAARERGVKHLSQRIDAQDFPNLHLLESRGWKTVDVSVKFSRAFGDSSANSPVSNSSVALASPDDAAWIRQLGSTTHGGTHYLNDPALPEEKTKEIFARWLDKCLEKLAYHVYVLKNAEGRGVGFVTYLRSEGFAKAVGRRPLILDFVLIDPAQRGRGLGPRLIAETLERERDAGFDYCELRTSMHNLPAVVAYEKLGFICCASDFALHRMI